MTHSLSALKAIVAGLLLGIWLPMTSHCLLEAAGLMPDWLQCVGSCAADSGHPGDCAETDSCASLESATYKMDEAGPVLPALPVAWVVHVFIQTSQVAVPPAIRPIGALLSPPHLLVTWQFFLRAAFPPRPPSLLS